MDITDAQTIHCLGIGGMGISSLARLFLRMGKQVTGSDLAASAVTEDLIKQGAKISIGANTVIGRPDLVVYSSAIPAEILAEIAEPKLSQAQAVGELMRGHYGIAVTGTNGKSTVTAMLGLILERAGQDCTVLLGAELSARNESAQFKRNTRVGQGKFFVAESDEYRRKMLDNHPEMIVLTNVAEDHLDYYRDLEEIKSAFAQYIRQLPAGGIVIYNADDRNSVDIGRTASCHKFTFGIHHYADLQAVNVANQHGRQTFDVHLNDQKIGTLSLGVPGLFNVANALAAALAALKLGVDFPVIQTVLADYAGLRRRFEAVGQFQGGSVISDYAHHPAGIAATLAAAREFFPGQKILTVFQPHQRHRTRALLGELAEALLQASGEIVIPEIFEVAGREQGIAVSSRQLAEQVNHLGGRALFAENLAATEQLLQQKAAQYDVILMMGAGDIDSLARKIVK